MEHAAPIGIYHSLDDTQKSNLKHCFKWLMYDGRGANKNSCSHKSVMFQNNVITEH